MSTITPHLQAWDVATIVHFPRGTRLGPGDLGAGVALATYRFQVAPLPLPDKALADACPDTPQLLAVRCPPSYSAFHASMWRRCRCLIRRRLALVLRQPSIWQCGLQTSCQRLLAVLSSRHCPAMGRRRWHRQSSL